MKRAEPQESKDALIVHVYKRIGDRFISGNHRGISLLSIPGKILEQCREPRCDLYSSLNAFDLVNMDAPWMKLKKIGCHSDTYDPFMMECVHALLRQAKCQSCFMS